MERANDDATGHFGAFWGWARRCVGACEHTSGARQLLRRKRGLCGVSAHQCVAPARCIVGDVRAIDYNEWMHQVGLDSVMVISYILSTGTLIGMTIPNLTNHGVLEEGIHDCTLEDVENIFGRFNTTDCRVQLSSKLREYVEELRRFNAGSELIVDGSFVTSKPDPNDIDLILVLPEGFDYARQVMPFEYNLIRSRPVKKKYGFDVFAAVKNTKLYNDRINFFQQVRGNGGLKKGLLRIPL